MKSGTTTLFDVLARHPAIAPASNKEPGFFAFEEVWSKGFDWFDTLFDFDPARHVYRLEASTDYTKAPFVTEVWERMIANPDVEVKLLYIMRHPLRRIESHARHVQIARKEIGQQISPITDHSLDQGLSPVNLAVSCYGMQLEAYWEAQAANRLLCLTLEELRAAPAETLGRIWAFLELDGDLVNTTLPISNAAGAKRRVDPRFVRLTKIRPLLALAKTVLPKRFRASLLASLHQPVLAEGRFVLNPQETQFLTQVLRADLERSPFESGWHGANTWKLPDL